MSVTVHEVLSMERFNNFRLIAGANGLDRRVTRAGFIDHESPKAMEEVAFEHEMIFSNLPMIQNSPHMITEYVQSLINAGSACFAIKTVFFKSIPQAAIELANEAHFPIFLFDDTFIESLILDVDELVNVHKRLSKKVHLIEELLYQSMDPVAVRQYALELNAHFEDILQVMYIKPWESSHRFDYQLAGKILGKQSLVIPTDEIIIIIMSGEHGDGYLQATLNSLGLSHSYRIGISDSTRGMQDLQTVLRQGRTALQYACFKEDHLVHYHQLGIYKFLLPLIDQHTSLNYYIAYIDSLQAYDAKHQSNLLETARTYIACDGDIVKTAEHLYQHRNTIRYRIKKIKSVLGLDTMEGMVYETLAIAVHLYELNQKRYLFRSF